MTGEGWYAGGRGAFGNGHGHTPADRDCGGRHGGPSFSGDRGGEGNFGASARRTHFICGDQPGLEARVVPREGFALDLIRSAGLKGKSLAARGRALGVLPLGAFDAWRIVSRRAPDVVIGVGGYSSGPVVLMAALRGVPTMVLEQNAVPGLTNKLLARVVSSAAVTYQSTLPHFGVKGFVAGNPVRPGFLAGRSQAERLQSSGVRVLIFGGSQGARAINAAMVEAATRLAAAGTDLSIAHQTAHAISRWFAMDTGVPDSWRGWNRFSMRWMWR